MAVKKAPVSENPDAVETLAPIKGADEATRIDANNSQEADAEGRDALGQKADGDKTVTEADPVVNENHVEDRGQVSASPQSEVTVQPIDASGKNAVEPKTLYNTSTGFVNPGQPNKQASAFVDGRPVIDGVIHPNKEADALGIASTDKRAYVTLAVGVNGTATWDEVEAALNKMFTMSGEGVNAPDGAGRIVSVQVERFSRKPYA